MNISESKYEQFFELSPDLLCIAGYDGYFKKINAAVSRTLGYSPEELYSRPINDFVHPDYMEVTAKARNELTQSKPLQAFENKYLTKSGESVWLSWTSLPVESDQLIFAIAKNVTHKKRLEADRNALLADVTRTNEEIMQFKEATSDDLRSPVISLLALFELLDPSKINDPETLRLIEVLQYAAEKIRKALDGYVSSLTEKASLEMQAQEIDLQKCLDEVLDSISTLVYTSKTSVVPDFSEMPRIKFNKAYMKSIFLNLISNSIKYSSPDRLPVITVRSSKTAHGMQISIADNGTGFDTTEINDQILRWHKEGYHSSKGIGLYLVFKQVAAFGGRVDISSEIGRGTTVDIYLNNR